MPTPTIPFTSHQPFKAVYTLFFVLVKVPLRLSVSALIFLRPKWRPHPQWTYSASMFNRLAKLMTEFIARTRGQAPQQLAPDKKSGDRFVLIRPPAFDDARIFSGVLSSSSLMNIDLDMPIPGPVGGTWFPSPPPPTSQSSPSSSSRPIKVALHFPGGAFVVPFDVHGMGAAIVDVVFDDHDPKPSSPQSSNNNNNNSDSHRGLGVTHLLMAPYRVSRLSPPSSSLSPTHFPAALLDAVTYYAYLTRDLGIPGSDIVVSGDSAGANLALALLRYLVAGQGQGEHHHQHLLPLPGCVVAGSPWVDIPSDAGRAYDGHILAGTDILNAELLQWGADAYLPPLPQPPSPSATGSHGVDEWWRAARPYVSPLHHPFRTAGVPVMVLAGEVEVFHDSVRDFAREMAEVNNHGDGEGEKQLVRFRGVPLATHDPFLAWKGMGRRAEVVAVLEEARMMWQGRR